MDLFEPVGGTQTLTDDEAKAKGPDFLIDDLRQRAPGGSVSFDFNLQLAQPGDNINSAVTPLPDGRPKVTLGRLTIRTVSQDAGGACLPITFNPMVLPKGVEPSADPMLAARAAPYAVGLGRRLGEGPSNKQRARRIRHANVQKIAKNPYHQRAKHRVGRQIRAEDRLYGKKSTGESVGIPPGLRRDPRQPHAQRIVEVVRDAGLVRAHHEAHPPRHAERQDIDRPPCREVVADRAEQALRQLLGAVHGDLEQAVADRRVLEALQQRLGVS